MHSPTNPRRPPHEFASCILEISKGCTYGRCLFCRTAQNTPFELVPFSFIEEDVEEIAATVRTPRRVLLLGGNPLGLPNDTLRPILELIREKLPTVTEVGGYMRTGDVKLKSDAELAELAALGVTDVTFGTECAFDPALERMRKGHSSADILEQYPRLEAAGIGYSFFYLCGFAGAGKCEEAARASAEVLSQTHPRRIFLHTVTPFEDTLLREEVLAGDFALASESEAMLDAATFLENLQCETVIMGEHDTNLFRIEGLLPRDREGMVANLRMRIAQTDDAKVRDLRLRMKEL